MFLLKLVGRFCTKQLGSVISWSFIGTSTSLMPDYYPMPGAWRFFERLYVGTLVKTINLKLIQNKIGEKI